jgi:glycosyltransferase involved in cell wall biosynthesis
MNKLLYAALQLPWPLDNGQKIVAFNDLHYLSRSFDIDVVSYIDPINLPQLSEYLAALKDKLPTVHFHEPIPHHILRGEFLRDKVFHFLSGLITARPFMVSKYRNRKYAQTIERLLVNKDFKVLYIESLAPTDALRTLPLSVRQRVKVVYRAYDIVFETLASYAKGLGKTPTALTVRIDALLSRRYERWVWNHCDLIVNVTRRMGELMVHECPDVVSKILHFPISVDVSGAQPWYNRSTCRALYVGTAHYPPNLTGLQWFLKECWPRVIDRQPSAIFEVVGRGGDLLQPVQPSVRIHNYVQDLSSFYNTADVFVVPLFSGSGVRLKILDALTHNLPVVSTTAGYAGLDLEPGKNILVADDSEHFASHISSLFDSAVKRQQVAKAGRDFVENNHSQQTSSHAVERLVALLDP